MKPAKSKTPTILKMTPTTESLIDDPAIAASWAAIDEADKLDIAKAEQIALRRKILLSAIFSVDVDGVIGSLTHRPGLLKVVNSDDVNALMRSRRETPSTTTID